MRRNARVLARARTHIRTGGIWNHARRMGVNRCDANLRATREQQNNCRADKQDRAQNATRA
eukprot:1156819-Lingulodinium_polyedra.AAC.1